MLQTEALASSLAGLRAKLAAAHLLHKQWEYQTVALPGSVFGCQCRNPEVFAGVTAPLLAVKLLAIHRQKLQQIKKKASVFKLQLRWRRPT